MVSIHLKILRSAIPLHRQDHCLGTGDSVVDVATTEVADHTLARQLRKFLTLAALRFVVVVYLLSSSYNPTDFSSISWPEMLLALMQVRLITARTFYRQNGCHLAHKPAGCKKIKWIECCHA